MSFQEAVRNALMQNYANFNGRASRPEFWYFVLAIVIATVFASIIDDYALGEPVLESIVTLGTIIPFLAVGARRLHDTDRSGWWLLIHVIPLIGSIVLIVWWVFVGSPGPNHFGPPPEDALKFAFAVESAPLVRRWAGGRFQQARACQEGTTNFLSAAR